MDGSSDVWQHVQYAHPALVAGSVDIEAVVLTLSTCPPFCNICLADFATWTDVSAHRGTNVTTGQALCTMAEVNAKRAEAAKTQTGCQLCKLPMTEGARQHFETWHARTCCVCYLRFWTQAEYDAHMYRHNEWLNACFKGREGFWGAVEAGTRPHCKQCLPRRAVAAPSNDHEETANGEQVDELDYAAIEQQNFSCWPEVEEHYRNDHAPTLQPPFNPEDLYMFAAPL
jgi:hypothetical protein